MPSIFDHDTFSANLFYPQDRVSPPPANARDFDVSVGEGVTLHARLHTRQGAIATVLLFHGNGECVSDYDGAAPEFARAGADLAIVDYRGYGASTGSPTLRTCLSDAHHVLAATLAVTAGRPLVVMGRSLGSQCAAELCQTARPDVIGYIYESGIADLDGLIRRRGVTLTEPLPEDDLEVFSPIRKLRRCATPMLILHGSEDTLIPPSEARMTFDALATRDKELVTISGRGHNNVSLHPRYWSAMTRFIARLVALKGTARPRSAG